MPLAPDVLPAARRYRPAAVEAVLREHYPRVSRIAYGLVGSRAASRGVVRLVMARSLHAIPNWADETAAANWFVHHTVLAARNARNLAKFNPDDEALIPPGPEPLPNYRAFVHALRKLPFQQVEAFLFQWGEQLDPRQLAVAMDCSTAAAGNHLAAANKSLSALAGADFQRLCNTAARAYQGLAPPEELIVGEIRPYVRRHLRRRFASRWVLTPLLFLLLAALAWGIYVFAGKIVY